MTAQGKVNKSRPHLAQTTPMAVSVHDIQSSVPLLLLAPDQCQVSTSQVYAIKIAKNCETSYGQIFLCVRDIANQLSLTNIPI